MAAARTAVFLVALTLLLSDASSQSEKEKRKTGIDLYFEQLKKPAGAKGIPLETLEEGREGRLLREAVIAGDEEGINKLINKGFVNVDDKNSIGWTALHVACAEGKLEMVELLISKGASVEAKDAEGHTPLHFAVSCRRGLCADRHHLVSVLLQHGASLHQADKSLRTALHTAASKGHTQACKVLLRKMIDSGKPHTNLLNAVETEGRSALHLAASHGQAETVKWLLEWGADTSITCKEGKTASDNGQWHEAVSNILKNHTPMDNEKAVDKLMEKDLHEMPFRAEL